MPRSGRTMTVLLPSETVPEGTWTAPEPSPERPILLTIPNGNSRLTDYHPERSALPNGLRLIHECRPNTGIVALELFVDAGLLREAKPGLAYLTGRLLEEGTKTRPAETLAEAIEDVGGTIDVGSTGVSFASALRTCPWRSRSWRTSPSTPRSPRKRFPGRSVGSRPSYKAIAKTRPSARTWSSAASSTAITPMPATRAGRAGTSPD